jgi:hypothetical protein
VLVAICLTVILIVVASAIGYRMLHGQPAWYTHGVPDSGEREQMARRVEDKLTNATSWSQSVWLAKQHAQAAPKSAAQPPPANNPLEISLTEAEINAFISKWDQLPIISGKMAAVLSDPQVSLEDGRLIVAASVKDLDTVVSVHLAPRVDSQGMLHLDVEKVMGGQLPLPQAVWDAYAKRLAGKIERDLIKSDQAPQLLPDGSANPAMVDTVLGKMLLHFLNGQPADPVVFLKVPVDNRLRNLPVKITRAEIADKTLTMRFEPLDADEKIGE